MKSHKSSSGSLRHLLLIAAALLVASGAATRAQGIEQQRPPSADTVVAAAVKQAAVEKKVVLIEFGASWCTWCRSFEAFVHSPEVGPIIAKNFVLVNLVVKESDDKKGLEHPGGQAAMDKWGGAKTGLPYYVFLDASGAKLADSNAMPDGTNIGFPATPAELESFVGLMDKTAPSLLPAERQAIVDYLKKTLRP